MSGLKYQVSSSRDQETSINYQESGDKDQRIIISHSLLPGAFQSFIKRGGRRLVSIGLCLLTLALPRPAAAQTGDLPVELAWSSAESDWTVNVAWGDYDGDGDLDLVAGNIGPNRLYRNEGGRLQPNAVWSSAEVDNTISMAWGDYDGDGDLDLAAGNEDSYPNRLYRNDGLAADGITPEFELVWSWGQTDETNSLAWGDYDRDGDLDLAVGNGNTFNRLYRNENGLPPFTLVWSWGETDNTNSLVWGDYDEDGYLDLAVGNGTIVTGQSNRVYRNPGGSPPFNLAWSSPQADNTTSVAWGDEDGDGDLDLTAGNFQQPNRLYRHAGGATPFNLVWSSPQADATSSVAWGDMDNDGDLDLAVGNLQQVNRLYRRGGGATPLSLVWSSDEADNTQSVAWGDVDRDGDLDLAVGNGNFSTGQVNRVYRNDIESMQTSAAWSSTGQAEATTSLAWGDVDGDGDLDLATGNGDERSRLYRHDGLTANGQPIFTSIWTAAESQVTYSLAWGDYDGDGDLDLLTGNGDLFGQPNRLYRNDNGTLTTEAVWASSYDEDDVGVEQWTQSVAWGDYDGDGDLDFAAGNVGANQLYRNDGLEANGQTPIFTLAWSSPQFDNTHSVAWGDYDGDGDLDLVVGNGNITVGQPNRLYRNDGLAAGGQTPVFNLAWSSPQEDLTNSIAWGDYDGDGDLDLAAGNFVQPNRLYRNDGVAEDGLPPVFTLSWSSDELDATNSLVWGDYDGDSDLDLAVGNGAQDIFGDPVAQPNRLYRNDGLAANSQTPRFTLVWTAAEETDYTSAVAWGDVDGDGDLDLAAGNLRQVNRVHLNQRRNETPLPNNPPYLVLSRPGPTDAADFFSSSQILTQINIPVVYKLFDPEGQRVPRILPEFSPNGGGQWFRATPGSGGDGTTNLTASPQGTTHTFMWRAEADLIKGDHVIFRLSAQPGNSYSPIQWPAVAGQSPIFRLAAPWFIKVVDDGGNPISGAVVYAAGQAITQTTTGLTVTNQAGLLNPGLLPAGTSLVALAQQAEQPTIRAAHEGWAYRTYLTNLNLNAAGMPQPFLTTLSGEQRLITRRTNLLILFNLVVSVEWDADAAYLAMLEDAFRKASAYLYDVTDGQMVFGQVTIYDKARYWGDADFQFSTKNTVRPYAFVSGITSPDKAHAIRIGRFWDGGSGNSGNWNEPRGYRTLIHEFGHYALYLYDAYFIRQVDEQGNFMGELPAACTSEAVRENSHDPINATMMYYQYNASELADKTHNWDENCDFTEQYRLNNGASDWETVRRYYDWPGDTLATEPAWILNTPTSRGGVMAGPASFPQQLLPFPGITVNNSGVAGGPARHLTVRDPQDQLVANALVALYTTAGGVTTAIDQGLTDRQGQITIYGAFAGSTIRASTFNAALAGAVTVQNETSYQLTLSPTSAGRLAAQASPATPYLNLVPGSDGSTLALEVHGAAAGGNLIGVVIPDAGGSSPKQAPLAYSPGVEAYTGQVSFSGLEVGSGSVQVSGLAGGQVIAMNSDYNLQRVRAITANNLYAEDGNFELHLTPGSIPADGYATILPTGYVPGPLPEGKQVVGSAYQVRLSGALVELDQEGLIRLHYHPAVMGIYTDTAIYYWDASSEIWQKQGGEPSEIDNALSVPATWLGIYALMGTAVVVTNENEIYLPVIVK